MSAGRGLETVIHKGPSTVAIGTINIPRGEISEVLLRGCGVTDELIA